MKKIFGIQAEINLTADEDIVKGIGCGLKNGSIVVADIFKELKPAIVKGLDKHINKDEQPAVENKESD